MWDQMYEYDETAKMFFKIYPSKKNTHRVSSLAVSKDAYQAFEHAVFSQTRNTEKLLAFNGLGRTYEYSFPRGL